MTTPPGYHTITPRMVVADTRAAVGFLRVVFDATGEVADGRPAEIRIGADATCARAMAAGAVSVETPGDTPYGDRRAMIRDPFGNVFQIATAGTGPRTPG